MLQSQPPSLIVRGEVDWILLSKKDTASHLPTVVTTFVKKRCRRAILQTMDPGSPPTSSWHGMRTGRHGGRGTGQGGHSGRRNMVPTILRH